MRFDKSPFPSLTHRLTENTEAVVHLIALPHFPLPPHAKPFLFPKDKTWKTKCIIKPFLTVNLARAPKSSGNFSGHIGIILLSIETSCIFIIHKLQFFCYIYISVPKKLIPNIHCQCAIGNRAKITGDP